LYEGKGLKGEDLWKTYRCQYDVRFAENAGQVSPIERLLNEFEAHETKEEKALDYYKKVLVTCPTRRLASCFS